MNQIDRLMRVFYVPAGLLDELIAESARHRSPVVRCLTITQPAIGTL
jgi:hypothetical protein